MQKQEGQALIQDTNINILLASGKGQQTEKTTQFKSMENNPHTKYLILI